ncbi:MAG: UDP-N-acetylmuramate dehydrogenase [Bacteroidales bacterium]|nr:UDP-N-acetylmuramate dehydrogenase [Candidatus Cryptobacteroides onthequi]
MITRFDNHDLSGRNTFGMKVSCACFIEYDSPEDLAELDIESLPQPVFHMGGGSNLLFTGDFPGTVIHSDIRYCRIVASDGDGVLVEAGAGVTFDDFCAWAADNELWGVENLSGIPGEVGASAVQNIGAYGVEVKDVITQVKCFDLVTRRELTFSNADCRYGYRDSMFKHAPAKGRYAVLSVLFSLSRAAMPKLDYGNIRAELPQGQEYSPAEIRRTVLRIRDAKLPDPKVLGSAGSFFKNPVITREEYDAVEAVAIAEHGEDCRVPHFALEGGMVKVPAAWMIEQCGFKGMECGNVAVYHRQPLVIVNLTGKASPSEVIAMEQRVIAGVKEKFNITLHPEVEHV